jgi:hypothetical protein
VASSCEHANERSDSVMDREFVVKKNFVSSSQIIDSFPADVK